MDKNFFKRKIYNTSKPLMFPCPTCNNGHLKVSVRSITLKKTAAEIKARKTIWGEFHEYDVFRFTSFPECDLCGESITITGIAKYYNEYGRPTISSYQGTKKIGFTPLFISPPINLFNIPVNCPDVIKRCLLKAFTHYWNDLSASANRIRTAIELILNEENIDASVTLHSRIEKFKIINPECGNKLMAIKWIGNEGSHSSHCTQDDILDGLELIEFVIDTLYERPIKTKELDKLSDEIIKNKTPKKK
jgi:hypothetical protein